MSRSHFLIGSCLMRLFFPARLALGCIGLVSCGFAFQSNSGSEVKDTPASDAVTQVNPKAFNAFNIWRDGQGSEILDYPQDYPVIGANKTPDGVFYVEDAAYWAGTGDWATKFIGVPTEGAEVVSVITDEAKVVNDVLQYPVKNGKQLKLKFTVISDKEMYHDDAVTYCKNQGLRLPTVRELFDFCAAGVTEPNYGPNFESGRYPLTARCGGRDRALWSASVFSETNWGSAWYFDGHGWLGYHFPASSGVRCVGAVPPTPTPTPEGRVNPKAFNAFNIWRDGQGSEILDSPRRAMMMLERVAYLPMVCSMFGKVSILPAEVSLASPPRGPRL